MSVFLLWFIFISAASVREIQTPRLSRCWQSSIFGTNFLQEVNDVASCSLALCKHHSNLYQVWRDCCLLCQTVSSRTLLCHQFDWTLGLQTAGYCMKLW